MCRSSCPTDYYVYLETYALAAGSLTQTNVDKMICKDWISSQPSTSSSQVSNMIGYEYSQTCLMRPYNETVKYGRIRQVVA